MGFKRLYFDIETSYCIGWFWRPSFKTSINYNQILKHASVICICYKFQGSDNVHHLTWDKGDDKDMIMKFKDIIKDADEVVGHNGDRFDLKWFRTRCLFHGVKSLPEIKSIDTLKISRSKFNFPSNRLDAIGKYLGLGGKLKTISEQVWHDVIQRNSRKAMKEMVLYCKRDVSLLEQVYLKLEGYSKPKTHMGVQTGGDSCDCPYCASERTYLNKRNISAKGTVTVDMKCNDCKKYFHVSLRAYNLRGRLNGIN